MPRHATTPPGMTTLVLLSGISVLSLNMFLPSLGHIAEEMQVSYGVANLSIAGYLVVTAILQVIIGPMSDRYGRRPVLLVSLALFTVASLGCYLAKDIQSFLAFRVLQGGVVSGMVLGRAAIRDMFPAQEAAARMGYVNMVMALAPMLGPLLGGVVDETLGWRMTFLLFTASGAGLLWLTYTDLGETNKHPSETFMQQFRAYPELFTSRRFWGYSFALTFSVGSFYLFIAGVPLVGARVFGLSPTAVGLGVGIISGGFMLGNFVSGRVAGRFSLSTMMIAGRLATVVGLVLGLGLLLAGFVYPAVVFGAGVFVGFGNGLTLPAGNAGAMSVRPRLAGSAAGLSGAMTVAGGAVLTTLAGAFAGGDNGAVVLLVLMLVTTLCGLASALYVRQVDLREGPPLEE